MEAGTLFFEAWKPIEGYETFYEVSDQGRVRSLPRTILRSDGVRQFHKGRILKPGLNSSKRWYVGLSKDGANIFRPVHKLVADAFIPNPQNYPIVRHYDDNPGNNAATNLRRGTYSDNQHDRVRNGIYWNGRGTKPERSTE